MLLSVCIISVLFFYEQIELVDLHQFNSTILSICRIIRVIGCDDTSRAATTRDQATRRDPMFFKVSRYCVSAPL
jgi:hypothetical protein